MDLHSWNLLVIQASAVMCFLCNSALFLLILETLVSEGIHSCHQIASGVQGTEESQKFLIYMIISSTSQTLM